MGKLYWLIKIRTNKFKYSLLILIFLLSTLFFGSLFFEKKKTLIVLDQILPPNITGVIRYFSEIDISHKKINNDYNVKFLPKTQFAVLDFQKLKLPFVQIENVAYLKILKKKPFVFDVYDNYVIIVPKAGTFYYQDLNETILGNNNFKNISSNLNSHKVLDIFIDNKDIYVSYVKMIDDCYFLYLAKSKIDLIKLNFKNIFESTECVSIFAKRSSGIQSGRIQKTKINNNSFMLLATAVSSPDDIVTDPKPQSDKSIYGKIISINLKNYEYSIFSKGHRNILGLSSIDDVILSTENGPRGGDEINRIYKGKNYGWPIASDGNKYNGNDLQKDYANHLDMNFEQPIFSFIPSIGISEIIKIDNKFAPNWQENYLVGSLFGKHIYRVKFNKTFNKINYFEKIFIGERMRDLKYVPSHSTILMSLENTGSLGILRKK